MEDNNWVIYNGSLIKANQSVVSVESRGLMYGDGCFETLRIYGGSYFKLRDHLARLQAGAYFLGIYYPAGLHISPLRSQIAELLRKNKITNEDAVVRIQLWRDGERGYSTQGNAKSNYAVLAAPMPDLPESISLATVDIKRIPNEALPSTFKLCNSINYITAADQASKKGADEALMQTIDGYLSETTIANIFWISGNTVFTPSKECDLLPGITRNVLIGLVGNNDGMKIKEGKFRSEDILQAEVVWICNSVRELVPVSRIDGQKFSIIHPLLDELKTKYKTLLNRALTSCTV